MKIFDEEKAGLFLVWLFPYKMNNGNNPMLISGVLALAGGRAMGLLNEWVVVYDNR